MFRVRTWNVNKWVKNTTFMLYLNALITIDNLYCDIGNEYSCNSLCINPYFIVTGWRSILFRIYFGMSWYECDCKGIMSFQGCHFEIWVAHWAKCIVIVQEKLLIRVPMIFPNYKFVVHLALISCNIQKQSKTNNRIAINCTDKQHPWLETRLYIRFPRFLMRLV